MNGFSRLAYVEAKLFLRETGAAIGVFGLPVALVVGFGLIPGFGDPQKGLSGQIGTEYIASISVAIVLAVLGLTGVPMVIGQYRERGILRRLGVTPAPQQTGWFIVSLLLGIGALFALGLLVAAVTPTARSAAGLGWLLFFPNMFLAGVYFPTEEMSPVMRQIGNFTPLGSALHALRDSLMGLTPRPQYLGIMAAYVVIAGALAARFFRWEQA